MTICYETLKHPRFVEFESSRFHHKDFKRRTYHFLTLYDLEENVLAEYAHLTQRTWIMPDNTIVTNGQIIATIDELCDDGMYIDLYVNDFYKKQASIKVKRVYRYLLTPTGEVKRRRGTGIYHNSSLRRLYDLKPVDDMSSIGSLSQIIPAI